MNKSIVYIAGPITGDPDYKRKFRAAAQKLEGRGYTVLNPAELPAGLRQEDYMRICHAMLDAAHMVVFLPGYRDSAGAQIEYGLASYTGKRILVVHGYLDIWQPPDPEVMGYDQ